jgi:hypothetical protein
MDGRCLAREAARQCGKVGQQTRDSTFAASAARTRASTAPERQQPCLSKAVASLDVIGGIIAFGPSAPRHADNGAEARIADPLLMEKPWPSYPC